MLRISNSNATNCSVWLDASIHPREWISTAVVTYIADILVKNFKKQSTSITNKDWYFSHVKIVLMPYHLSFKLTFLYDTNQIFDRHIVPVLNPDGYEYTHTCDRMWRKNRARHEGACVGVDLNRNFR